MTKILIVNSSALGEASVSSRLTRELAERWRAIDPAIEITERDIGSKPPPHLVPETVAGVRAVAQSEAELKAMARSDTLIAELQDADVIVIGAPMYNFGIPSTLKAWFDHVLRPGITFRYSSAGPEGLLKGKRAIVIETRGGLYSEGPAQGLDSQEPHLHTMLGFAGISEVVFVRVERLGMAGGREAAIEAALAEIDAHGQRELAIAA